MENILAKNLAALQAWNTAAADAVAHAVIPSEWQEITGRDGSLTYARPAGVGRVEWLGGTSMPSATASAIVASMELGMANGLGLGIGTGHEWLAAAQRMAPGQMMYVLETDAAAARMTLSVCDLTSELKSGRIVLLIGAADAGKLDDQLVNFVVAHRGFEPPIVMHPLPSLGSRRHALVAVGERVVRAAVARRAQDVADAAARVAEIKIDDGGSRRVLVLLNSAADAALAGGPAAAAIGRALAHRQEIYVETLSLREYSSVSVLGRLEALARVRPHVIVSDLFRPQLSAVLPAGTRIWTFLPSRPARISNAYWRSDRWPAAMCGPDDRLFCHADVHRQRLEETDIPPGQITVLPLALERSALDAPRTSGRRIVLLGDAAPLEPEEYGLLLPSHQSLWRAATEILSDDWARVHPDMAADIVKRAGRRAGVEVDRETEQSIVLGIRDILLPAMATMMLARSLAGAGVDISLHGNGWDRLSPAFEMLRPRIGAANALDEAAIVVQAGADGAILPGVLEAAARGAVVVTLKNSWDGRPGTLASVLEPAKEFITASEAQIAGVVKGLLRDEGKRAEIAQRAARKIAAEHTWDARIAELNGI